MALRAVIKTSVFAALSLVMGTMTLSPIAAASETDPFQFEIEEVAQGVWTGIRSESTRFPVMGNATIVIGTESVLVFDGGGVPGMADQIIAKIKDITDLPVSHVVISHWHGDHNFGVHRFEDAFENVQFIAHDFTDRAMNSHKIDYILGYPTFVEKRLPKFQKQVETGLDSDGNPLSEDDKAFYKRMIKDAPHIDREYKKVKLVEPDLVIDGDIKINLGGRDIEIKHVGHGNTEGDLILWLPNEKIVSTGDIIVSPAPYAFNVPPRAWAQTLKNINALNYKYLVPGHGAVQTDTALMDLTIEAAEFIANERDRMIAEGLSPDDVKSQLSLSSFEDRYTDGDPSERVTYEQWFEKPLIEAAIKELTGEPMVPLKPRKPRD